MSRRPKTYRTLPLERFEELLPKLNRKSAQSVQIARLVLVNGLSPAKVAEQLNITRQGVSRVLLEVEKIIEAVPHDWVLLSELMPPSLADEVRERIAQEKEKLLK